jgi:hypothetical protein
MVLNKYLIQKKEFKIDKVFFVKLVFKHDYQKSKNIIFFIHRWKLNQKEEDNINKQSQLIDKKIYPNIFILHQEFLLPKESLGENIFELPRALKKIIAVSNFKGHEVQILSLFSLFSLKFEKASLSLEDIKKIKNYSRKEFHIEEILEFLKKCPLILNEDENYTFTDYNFENYFSAKEFNKFEKTNYNEEYPQIRNFSQINQYLLTEQKKSIEIGKRFDEYLKIKRDIEKLALDQLYEKAANQRDYSIKFFNKKIISYWSEMNLNNWKKNEL